jgi:hypothetical protein
VTASQARYFPLASLYGFGDREASNQPPNAARSSIVHAMPNLFG